MRLSHLPLFTLLLLPLWLVGCGRGPLLSGAILFQEQFVAGQTADWYTERDELGQSYVAEESLLIALDAADMAQYTALQEPLFDDFVLEVDATQLEGSLNNSYGLLFRLQSNEAFYRFDITGTGLFVVEKQTAAGQWQRFSNGWQESAAIVQGLGRVNRLKVSAVGTALTFYINDQQVASFVDGSFSSGKIALDASTFGQGGLVVSFDNVVVRRP
ncbi:MAG: hypothetical protein OT477_12085 [Chloroflexi bacterium]|nr:hypothetical protein [Chloroflexota bacterium]